MEAFYFLVFGALSAVVAALEFSKTSKDRITTTPAFNSFKNNYILVYSLMMAGDWLQGPYVYYLYTTYGYGKGDIGHLFIAGFGSSMLFGTIVGSLADKQGRKRACVTYCITYILSCITKHSPQYKILMVGRILGGIATSLLFSSFESWLVAEHNKRAFDQQWLSLTFSKAIFLGNGLVAILAGLFGNVLVDTLNLGPVSPFDAASCFLAIGMAIILSSWTENYGDTSENKDLITQFKGAAVAIASDEKIALLGAIQSLFEGSMYTFVFLWTPALSPNSEEIPHGFIFATFMLSSMLGSSLASRLLARSSLKVESYMQIVFAVSAVCLFIPVLTSFLVTPSTEKGGGITFSGCIQLLGFCAFEACVGIFWPSIMKMRSQYIPEEARSTIMNFFRIPLNIFVCVVLYNVDSFPITVMFGMCSIFLFLASVLQKRLSAVVEKSTRKERGATGSSLDLTVCSIWLADVERHRKSDGLLDLICYSKCRKIVMKQLTVTLTKGLVFLYPPSEDSVIQVTKQNYNSCNLKNPILYMNNGNSLFNITRPGEFYFTSGAEGHCEKLQKLHISIGGGNGTSYDEADSPAFAPSPSYTNVFGSIPVQSSNSTSASSSGKVEISVFAAVGLLFLTLFIGSTIL
uniref:Phytocyanin domain-containing protein n=1 Tax=Solanum lycopersicum TaxID=4081 RepID=A0A3Q7HR33_SOLLC